VNQVRSSAAAVRAKSAARTPPAPAQGGPTQASPSEPTPPPSTPGAADVLAQAPAPSPSPSALTARGLAASANQAASVDSAAAESGVAAFGALAHPTASSESLPPRNESTLAAETQLLDRAFAALAAGDRSTASALVAEHARRFPNGLLRQERERARNRLAQNPKGE